MKTITLYRPVGLTELRLIKELRWQAFPPRLAWQPIFYPVLNEAYAAQIAREWNTNDEFSSYLGAVTKFNVAAAFIEQYEVQNVGANEHDELWIPSENLQKFNSAIIVKIEVVNAFFGCNFRMPGDEMLTSVLNKFL